MTDRETCRTVDRCVRAVKQRTGGRQFMLFADVRAEFREFAADVARAAAAYEDPLSEVSRATLVEFLLNYKFQSPRMGYDVVEIGGSMAEIAEGLLCRGDSAKLDKLSCESDDSVAKQLGLERSDG